MRERDGIQGDLGGKGKTQGIAHWATYKRRRVKDNSQVAGWVMLLAGLPLTNVAKQLEEKAIAACLWRPLRRACIQEPSFCGNINQ